MKRKVKTKAVIVKRKKLCSSVTYSSEKKLEGFWSNNKKDKEQHSDREFSVSSDVPLVKNPSKQTLPIIPITQSSTVNYKNKILFNENFIEELKLIFEQLFTELRSSLLNHPFSDNFFEIEVYNEYMSKNISNILIKFIQQVHDDFLFIPKSFMEKNMLIDKDKLKLFEGINDSNISINLQYYPINSDEVIYFK